MKREVEIPEEEWPLRARVAKHVVGCNVVTERKPGEPDRYLCGCDLWYHRPPHGEGGDVGFGEIRDYAGEHAGEILDREDLRIDLRTFPGCCSCSVYASDTGDEDGDPDSGYPPSAPTWQEAVCVAVLRAVLAVRAREMSE